MENSRKKSINFKLYTILSSRKKSHTILLFLAWNINRAFVHHIHCVPIIHLATVLVITSTIVVLQCLCLSNSCNCLMLSHNVYTIYLLTSHRHYHLTSSQKKKGSIIKYFERCHSHITFIAV
jgi:hypothetical protein